VIEAPRGAIFGSSVVSELTRSFANLRPDAPLFWRDAIGHEIFSPGPTGLRRAIRERASNGLWNYLIQRTIF
jgi:hypothetical protein